MFYNNNKSFYSKWLINKMLVTIYKKNFSKYQTICITKSKRQWSTIQMRKHRNITIIELQLIMRLLLLLIPWKLDFLAPWSVLICSSKWRFLTSDAKILSSPYKNVPILTQLFISLAAVYRDLFIHWQLS